MYPENGYSRYMPPERMTQGKLSLEGDLWAVGNCGGGIMNPAGALRVMHPCECVLQTPYNLI